MRRFVAGALAAAGLAAQAQAPLPLDRVKLPPGFTIELFADRVQGARSMAVGEKGTVFVGTRRAGRVYAIRNDGRRATEVLVLASGLTLPNGVAVKDGALYVAELTRVLRYDGIEAAARPPPPVVVYDKYPEGHHGWKYLRFGPDGWLYTQVGAPCNVCDREPPYATITRLKPAAPASSGTGSGAAAMEIFAHGVRNSVGFDWHPDTGELWFTDNGRDMMGDDVPPDELNHAPRAGMHFGFPFCHGGDVPDPEFTARPCSDFTPPARKLGAHVAALGMRFYTGSMFPAEYRNRIFIAEHGSWNRSKKSGYRIMTARVEGGRVTEYSVFAEGFLDVASDTAWGRPVDVLQMPDGSLLVSDDHANAIYRISYRGP